MNESEYEYWFRKRMEEIPMPVDMGEAHLTEEHIEQGRKTLLELIEQAETAEQKKERINNVKR